MVWRLPKKAVKNIRIISGKAKIKEQGNEIEVQPENDSAFKVQYEEASRAP